MRLASPDARARRIRCFICERDTDGVRVVDTKRDFFPVGRTRIDGRKYVCERCVKTMALCFEDLFVSRESVDGLAQSKAIAETQVAELSEAIKQYSHLDEALKKLAPKAATKAAPRKAPVKKEAAGGSAD